MKVADMQADNPGSWMLHCHVADHMESGMYAKFVVYPADVTGADREPQTAFFGMPEAAQTLRFQKRGAHAVAGPARRLRAQSHRPGHGAGSLSHLRKAFIVQIGTRKIEFRPDGSGISAGSEGLLVVKNSSLYGNGTVTGGTLNFDLTLKGSAVRKELEQANLIKQGALAAHPQLHLDFTVGPAHHAGAADLKLLPP